MCDVLQPVDCRWKYSASADRMDKRHTCSRAKARFAPSVQNNAGLSSILAGRGGVEAIQRIPDFVALSLLPAGPLPPNPQELLGRSTFPEMLNAVLPNYDVILIDTPPAAEYADTQMIAARAGAALVVARTHMSSLAATQQLAESLTQVGVNLVGSVLTEF
jgi:Mrp family chromosome partitioning ATPase